VTDLSGGWSGNYIYPGSLAPVPFTLELRDSGGRLSGIVTEPAPAYMGGGEVQAVITGARSGSSVRFTKVYDALEHFLAPVRYEGAVDEDETEISGHWHIEGDWSGGFVMTRPKPEQASEVIEEEIETDR
jgi:hypothetical protein